MMLCDVAGRLFQEGLRLEPFLLGLPAAKAPDPHTGISSNLLVLINTPFSTPLWQLACSSAVATTPHYSTEKIEYVGVKFPKSNQ